jgi:alkylation response protein AidB-like acyl-CoA dehydrogenase
VGISQLTTSRQHLGRPILTAKKIDNGWSLHGKCPWVTGADSVNTLVTGAVPLNSKESQATPHFFILHMNSSGIKVAPPMDLLALTGSRTSSIELEDVSTEAEITPQSEKGPQTGGLGTTALAIGSTRASLAILEQESLRRDALKPITSEIEKEVSTIEADLFEATTYGINTRERNLLRQRANTLVTRTSQATLTASKGAGFVKGHPIERLIRESMFFLVWSCPQSVTESLLCDFAGIESHTHGPSINIS